MQRNELNSLTRSIQSIYPTYEQDDRLLDFEYTEVKKKAQLHKTNEAPTFEELTEGLTPIDNNPPVVMQCEYCKEKELVSNTNEWLEKHRVCQKIDFIDRQSKKIRGVGINKLKYYQMSSYELEKNYRKVMEHYLENKDKGTQFYERI